MFIFRYDFTPTEDEKTAVLKMFKNDLIIPKNFISLENYKTKTNPQTTMFCDKLFVDDPLALVLGQWPRSNLSCNEKEIDSTFSSFVNSTVCSINEDNLIDKSSEKLSMSPFILPEPKNDTICTDDNPLLDGSSSVSITNIQQTLSEESTNDKSSEKNQLNGKYVYLHKCKKKTIIFIIVLYVIVENNSLNDELNKSTMDKKILKRRNYKQKSDDSE